MPANSRWDLIRDIMGQTRTHEIQYGLRNKYLVRNKLCYTNIMHEKITFKSFLLKLGSSRISRIYFHHLKVVSTHTVLVSLGAGYRKINILSWKPESYIKTVATVSILTQPNNPETVSKLSRVLSSCTKLQRSLRVLTTFPESNYFNQTNGSCLDPQTHFVDSCWQTYRYSCTQINGVHLRETELKGNVNKRGEI